MKRGFFINATKDKDEAEILIYEQIGKSWWDDSGVGAKRFAEDLRALGDVKVLNVRINSPGGDVFEGAAIKTQLEQHKATKNVFIDGLAASAASYIAMAGNRVEISPNAMFMIHNAWGIVIGNAADMRQHADLLAKIDETIADMYKRRTKKSSSQIKEWMDAETWFSADEAVKHGFADALMADAKEASASFDLSPFKNAPKIGLPKDDKTFLADQEMLRRRLELLKARSA